MSNYWQKKIDGFWTVTVLRLLPSWIRPNQLTILRLILLPVLLYFLASGVFVLAFVFFLLIALSDSLDGSLARVRHKESAWGVVLDPLADRLLIMLTSIFLLYFYPLNWLLLAIIIFDLLFVVGGTLALARSPKYLLTANRWGKSKMFFQVAGILGIFLALVFNSGPLVLISGLLILVAIVLTFIAGAIYLAGILSN
ncbi:MAG: CDP-alcohol phosphatidyltransferase family protein [Patescibacteria group bacterium]